MPDSVTSGPAIETILLEERRYPPPPEFAAQANAQPEIYERDFEEFWETEGARARHVVRALHEALRVGAAVREVVPRRQAERRLQLRRPPRRGRATATRSPTTGRASRRTSGGRSRSPTSRREVVKLANALKRLGVKKGTPVGIYMGMVPEAAGRDARLRAARRAAHGRLRRLLGRLALRTG